MQLINVIKLNKITNIIQQKQRQKQMGGSQSKQSKTIKIPQNINLSLSNAKLDQITILKQDQNSIIFELPIQTTKSQRKTSQIAGSVASTRPSQSTHKYSSRSSYSINNSQVQVPKRPPSKPKPGLTCTVMKQKKAIFEEIGQKKQFILKKVIVSSENQYSLRKALETIQEREIEIQNQNMNPGKSFVFEKQNNHVCKLVGFEKEYDGFMCGKHSAVSMVFQYFGHNTLWDEVKARSQEISSKTRRAGDYQSTQQILSHSFKLQQLLKITKFLLQIAQILPKILPTQTPTLSLSDIFLQQNTTFLSSLKYRHPLDSLYSEHRDSLNKYSAFNYYYSYSIETTPHLNSKEDNMEMMRGLLKNIATCILSVALLENCYESCFGNMGEICQSICERKLEFLYEIYSRENDEKTVREFCVILQMFLLQKNNQTLTLTKAKSIFSKLYLNFQKQAIKNKIQMSSMNQFDQYMSKSPILQQKQRNSKEADTSLSMQLKRKQKGKHMRESPSINRPKFIKSCQSMNKNDQNVQNSIGARDFSLNRKKDWNIDKSSERKIEINQSLMPRTKQWVIQNQMDFKVSCVERKQSMKHHHIDRILQKYQQIDKRWSEDEELFKGMPQFSRFSSQLLNLHFEAAGLQPIKAQGKHQYVFLR